MTVLTRLMSVLSGSAPSGSPLSKKQVFLVDQANIYLIGRHEEIADEGGVWEEKDTSTVLDLMLQALGSSWDEFEQTYYS